jgi:hypothetical protein
MSSYAAKGSESAQEYALKKREQIEAAKRLREERKQANSLLKNAGEQFVRGPGQGNSAPGGNPTSTSSSGFSQKSGYSGGGGGGNGAGTGYGAQYGNGSSASMGMSGGQYG